MVEDVREDNITCPYCGAVEEDSWEFNRDEDEDYTCSNCDKKFRWYRNTTVEYECVPDCELNNEEHDFPEFDKARYHKELKKYFRCRYCKKCGKWDSIDTDKEGNELKGDEDE